MVQPLTKRRTTGELYTRPPQIEAAIERSLILDRGELLRRARIADPKHPEFIQPECLVHIVRSARRASDHELSNPLLGALFERCAAMLLAAITGRRSQRAEDLRREVLDRFADKFLDGASDALDIFEVRFGLAFRGLRIDVIRPTFEDSVEFIPLPGAEDDNAASEDAALGAPATQESQLFSKELAQAAWRLPKEQRYPIVLVYLMGYAVESDDPTKKTAATMCRVSGRTIRARLAQGIASLRKLMEEE